MSLNKGAVYVFVADAGAGVAPALVDAGTHGALLHVDSAVAHGRVTRAWACHRGPLVPVFAGAASAAAAQIRPTQLARRGRGEETHRARACA